VTSEAAVIWYRDVLGLKHLFTFGSLAFFDCQGVRLFLSASQEAGSTAAIPFSTSERMTSRLRIVTWRSRHVKFRGAPHMIHRHESGVEEWMAFFEDVDGKLLALMSQVEI
jgi:catechol 2,3-dioxygenase-like lactoylglutathione lyase family enzyme